MAADILIYTDGGSRNNPGEAAIGVVINKKEYNQRIGIKTNNEAEYMALIFALKKAADLAGKEKAKSAMVEVRMDSELVIKQMQGKYKVKSPGLKDLFIEASNNCKHFKSVHFVHIPREDNSQADRLVNEALDA
jgi:ribonuclease HI